MTNYPPAFYRDLLSRKDYGFLRETLQRLRRPDLIIQREENEIYLYRWHVIPRNDRANAYLHVQVQDDPGTNLHDHAYDNTSVILSGGYVEEFANGVTMLRRENDVVHRPALLAHRLHLAPGQPYSMTLFTTGPRVRQWGFYTASGWVPHSDYETMSSGISRPVLKSE